MLRFAKKRLETEEEDQIIKRMTEEELVGAKRYLSHPRLIVGEPQGASALENAANISYLCELAGDSITHLNYDEWCSYINGSQRVKKHTDLFIVRLTPPWGERAYALATRKYRYLIEELDTSATFHDADANDIFMDWEDEAWEELRPQIRKELSVDIKSRLCLYPEKKQKQLMWDAYVHAKDVTGHEPIIMWNRVIIRWDAIKRTYMILLGRLLFSAMYPSATKL